LKAFPVDPRARPQFADAFGSHRGTDIFAAVGSALIAVDDGDARAAEDPKGGNVIYLRADDGTVYYYAHLSSYVGQFPRRVTAGEQIGAVGTSGNALGKTPHLHFEVHPNGGAAVDPFPLLAALSGQPAPAGPTPAEAGGGGLLVALLLWWGASRRRRRV
jgi:murein DD-endopeptidase MepM/ murein hydrolase activator NlpD